MRLNQSILGFFKLWGSYINTQQILDLQPHLPSHYYERKNFFFFSFSFFQAEIPFKQELIDLNLSQLPRLMKIDVNI
jgi:hypothetical protein